MAALGLAAGPAAAQDELKIGMVNLSLCCAYFVGMDAAVKDEATHFSNVTILSTDAGGDVAKLTEDVEDLLNQGAKALIVSGAWIEAAPAALEAIGQAGVPVVMVDRLLKGGEFTSWVGPDNRAIGEGIGAYIAERLGGKGKVVIIRGGPADNTIGSARSDGVKSKFEGTGIEALVAPGWGEWSADGGFQQMEDMLSKEAEINAVFCENNSMCLGAQKAIADAGKRGRHLHHLGRRREGRAGRDHEGGQQLRRHRPQLLRPDRPRRLPPRDGDPRRRRAREGDRAAVADHHHRQRGEVLQSGQHLLSFRKGEATRPAPPHYSVADHAAASLRNSALLR